MAPCIPEVGWIGWVSLGLLYHLISVASSNQPSGPRAHWSAMSGWRMELEMRASVLGWRGLLLCFLPLHWKFAASKSLWGQIERCCSRVYGHSSVNISACKSMRDYPALTCKQKCWHVNASHWSVCSWKVHHHGRTSDSGESVTLVFSYCKFQQRLWQITSNRISDFGVVPSRQQWGQVGIWEWAGWLSDCTD